MGQPRVRLRALCVICVRSLVSALRPCASPPAGRPRGACASLACVHLRDAGWVGSASGTCAAACWVRLSPRAP
eukprot:14947778-Alexandrium_andersonii.AAC.1